MRRQPMCDEILVGVAAPTRKVILPAEDDSLEKSYNPPGKRVAFILTSNPPC